MRPSRGFLRNWKPALPRKLDCSALFSLVQPCSALDSDLFLAEIVAPCLVLAGQEAAELLDGIVGNGHLAEVVLPHVGLDGPPGERPAGHLDHVALGIHP